MQNPPLKIGRSIERGFAILSCICHSNSPISLSEISKRAGFDKATTSRILATLVALGFVSKNLSNRRYGPGPGLYGLMPKDIKSVCRPHLKDLLAATNETICLIKQQGIMRECIDVLEPDRELRVVATLGRFVPIQVGSSGRVLLAFRPIDEAKRILGKTDWVSFTPQTELDRDKYLCQLEKVRELGYATTIGEITLGSSALSAPVFDNFGNIIAAITVRGPESRMTQNKIEQLAPTLIKTAQAISLDLN
jgi:IclR family transcriptional regulator, KDG regulon repressor